MKSVYWRPQKASKYLLTAVGVLSLAGLAIVEALPAKRYQPGYGAKLAASQLAHDAMETIKRERLLRGHAFDMRFDPAQSGMVGQAMTATTSLPADLVSKQTTVNPNFAAAVVDMLVRGGVQAGDCVAVGYSGSFPALNLCVCAALESLSARPIIIASTASSQFGANIPDLLWVDMEKLLCDSGHLRFRSTAASIGGYGDRGRGMSEDARQLFVDAIQRNNLRFINPKTLAASIDERMRIYGEESQGMAIKAYINVGGGAASVRGSKGMDVYPPGLSLKAPAGADQLDSVITRFVQQGIPVINLARAKSLAREYDFPLAPAQVPLVGVGEVFVRSGHSRWLAGAVLLVIFAMLRAFVLSDVGYRIRAIFSRRTRAAAQAGPAELGCVETGPQLMV